MMSRAVVSGQFNSASTTFYQHGGHHADPENFQGKTKPYSDSSNAKGRTIEGEYTREDK
jgi:hypothetical protein